ncbi:3-ketosteroid reductase-like protein [Lineolata rhizophorae]|uniref:3-ketosteroid reductase-like protein n=1 Tax=Lineolata rhizophorae TaxID=578093 RepID=A0A6A6P9M1_9PEZI|nr:3-ketosteroid reductase-like protein [Lineolata rhizophorae]
MADGQSEKLYVLVTGANSGLGFSICCRLIDEFLQMRPQSQSLVLILTTRDREKADDTVHRLRQHLFKHCRRAERTIPGVSMLLQRRIHFESETLDLTSLISVQLLARRLLDTVPRLDALVLNAGIGGWTAINWPLAIYLTVTDLFDATTYPIYKIAKTGWLAKRQLPSKAGAEGAEFSSPVDEPRLGQIFCANVFGHYLLAHYLVPTLSRGAQSGTGGRIIWISSIEGGLASLLSRSDIMGLASKTPYESSKRLTDILALTYDLPSTAPWVDRFLAMPTRPPAQPNAKAGSDPSGSTSRPKVYVAHPGICFTAIMPIPWILQMCQLLVFYFVRLLGSVWHVVDSYSGATAPVWLILTPQTRLDEIERKGGKGKWGSGCDRWGRNKVLRSEVEHYGIGGIVGQEIPPESAGKHSKPLTEEDKGLFEEEGRECWKQMEEMRELWERKLEEALGERVVG